MEQISSWVEWLLVSESIKTNRTETVVVTVVIVCIIGGAGYIFDALAGGYSPPMKDAKLDSSLLSAEEVAGRTTIVFSRPLDTKDSAGDVKLADANYLIWSYSSSDSVTTKHGTRGFTPFKMVVADSSTGDSGTGDSVAKTGAGGQPGSTMIITVLGGAVAGGFVAIVVVLIMNRKKADAGPRV